MHRALVRLRGWWGELRLNGPEIARGAAIIYLASLAIMLTTAWHASADVGDNTIAGFPAWHLGFLLMMGAAAATLTLAGRDNHAGGTDSSTGVSELMAQMSHELRTPLNAVIGFSDVMLRELHGPLGNVRYQEYAHHISESGGRLLKSSEEALAVTEAMTALMADRRRGKRERLVAATLLRDAWREAMPSSGTGKQRLALTTCSTCDILCERRPTVQALEHLLHEAQRHAMDGGTVEVIGRRQGGRRSLEIRAETAGSPAAAADATGNMEPRQAAPLPGSLRIILARLLLDVQGATLTCQIGEDGAWAATIEFPGRG